MFRIFKAVSDAYITDRVISGDRSFNANMGQAGSLDLFKIYGNSMSGTVELAELSRALIKFDLSGLLSDHQAGKIDINHPSFNCTLSLSDVYYGQPTPSNFKLKVYPLAQPFDEGMGRDIVFFQDNDVSNFLTASYSNGTSNLWFLSGANAKGGLGSSGIDVYSSGNLGAGTVNLWTTQSFTKGSEHLLIDVTRLVSATLVGLLPNYGFRISFDESQEDDLRTYFVKRFGSSQAVDPYVQPKLIFKYNDSIVSNESNFTFDSLGNLFLYNYVKGNLTNALSGVALSPVTGVNCMLLRLSTPISNSFGFTNHETYFTASQHRVGSTFIPGVYSASVILPAATSQFHTKIVQSGSVKFDQIWTSFDHTVTYFSGTLTVEPPQTSTGPTAPRRYYVNVTNVATEYLLTDIARMKVFIFDYSKPIVTLAKVPIETPSVIIENAYYSIRDVANHTVVIPFDITYGSTKLSADSQTMYFDLWMSSLVPGRAYTIDLLLNEGGQHQIYRDVSPAFRIVEM